MQSVKRLITHFVPDNYQLDLTLQREDRRFSGVVTISGNVIDGSDSIILHSKDLAIFSVTLDGKTADFAASDHDELYITQQNLTGGHHTLTISYDAEITDAMHGLYPCYFEVDGQKKELLATQFESHHAREVFPCIDEPEAKATFNVCLTTELNVVALSNMPIDWQREEDGMLVSNFLETPKMSPYLLAWVIGDMHKKSGTTKRGVEVNIWATPAQKSDSLDFALDIAIRSIEFYESYFGTEYPLPKSDHVALPDFSSGAMENWGLITYREVALLADPESTSISARQYIATVIAHELAHQWFGNLVTMKWWNNLWLNESFATLMEYIAIDSLEPKWNIWLDFASSESVMALRRDSIDGVQAVQVDVHHPDEIGTLFDGAIVYAKGARLLRMLQHFVGDAAFQKGLKQYFVDFAYGNTEANDLWNAVAKASGKDIVTLMNTWISQPGYPVVRASLEDGSLTLSQEQFFVGPHKPSSKLWPIPLNASEDEVPTLFDAKTEKIPLKSSDMLQLNVADTAHFITHYSPELFEQLINKVTQGSMAVVDRMQLLNEATLLARGGLTPSADLLKLVVAFKDETSEPVWNMIFVALAELRKFTEDDKSAEKKLRSISAEIAKKQYERLGWTQKNNESEEDSKLRSTILSMTLYGEEPSVLAKAKEIYETTEIEKIDPELRSLILSSVVRNGDELIVDTLMEVYKTTQLSDLQSDLSVAITSTKNPEKIDQLLDYIKDKDVIRKQDASHWYVYLVRGKESRRKSWQWIQDNWDWVIDTYAGDKSYDVFPRYIAGSLRTESELAEFHAFFDEKTKITALTRTIKMGISEIEGRIELLKEDGPGVRKALLDY